MNKLFQIKDSIDKDKLQGIHDFSCKILETSGMRLINKEMLDGLEKKGCKIDRDKSVAFIPKSLIEDTLEDFRKQVDKAGRHLMINGGVAYDVGDRICAKFGAIAPRFYDWDSKKEREALEEDLVNSIKIGELLDEMCMVGCPMYVKEVYGKKIDPNFTPIVNAMLLAKHTKKLVNSEVNSKKQLKYLMEMGIVAKGSLKAYKKNPCFITAKESISPLLLDKDACEVLVELAKNGLPATMIPMPIMGASTPVTISGSVAVTNAEVIATMAAVRSVVPDAIVGGGSMASYMDMRGKGIKFNVMDAIKVDMTLCQLYEVLYGLDFGYGIYSSDSKVLCVEFLLERMYKILGSFFVRKFNYVIGQYDQGMVFSPELALAEIEMIKQLHELHSDFNIDDLDSDLLDCIKSVGHGGNFMAEMHTLNNFRDTFRSEILEEDFDAKTKFKKTDIFGRANAEYKELLKKSEYRIDSEREKEIDKIFKAAHKDIVGTDF